MPEGIPATGGAVQPVNLGAAPYQKPNSGLEALLERATEGPDPDEVGVEDGEGAALETVGEPQGEPEIKGNPYARARVLEREKRILEQRMRERDDQFNQLIKAIEEGASGKTEDDDEPIDEGDPLTRLDRKQEATNRKLEQLLEQQKESKQVAELMHLEAVANAKIQEFAVRADGVEKDLYKKAAAHYLNVLMSDKLEDTDLSVEEAKRELAGQIAEMKIKFVKSGKNPGEEFFKRAVLHGFVVPKVAESPSPTPAPTAKDQIAKAKGKKDVLASLSSVQGTVKRDGVGDLSKLNEKENFRRVLQLAREKNGSMMKVPSLAELLAHKLK